MINFLKYKAAPALIFLALLFGLIIHQANRAEANPHLDPAEYCNALAQFAWRATELRDQGYPIENHAPYISRIENTIFLQDVIIIVRNIYTQPHLSPADEATIAFDFCYRVHGA